MKNEFVATGLVLDKEQKKILLVHHKKFNKWLPPGGHLEHNELPHEGVIREVLEETGIQAEVVSAGKDIEVDNATEKQLPTPFCVMHQNIPETPKEDAHRHVDFIYLMRCSEQEITPALREVYAVGWFSKDEVEKLETFEGVRKLCDKVLQ